MRSEFSDDFAAVERSARVVFAGHRELRAILTALHGSAARLHAAQRDYSAFLQALEPEGSMLEQDDALVAFCVAWVSTVDCTATTCHHLGAVRRPDVFATSESGLRNISLRSVAKSYERVFVNTGLCARLLEMLKSPAWEMVRSYRDVLAHRQMLGREVRGQDYGDDQVPANPKAHPAEWQYSVPLRGFMATEQAFLEEWIRRTWLAMGAFLEKLASSGGR